MSPRVVIQRVAHRWTKQSRGGEGARRRNAVPLKVTLPLNSFTDDVTVHAVEFPEQKNFRPQESLQRRQDIEELDFPDLVLEWQGDTLAMIFLRNPANEAIVDRGLPPEKVLFALAPEEWGRLRYNARYSDWETGDWWYEQTIYSVALTAKTDVDLFVRTRPDHRYVELATLH